MSRPIYGQVVIGPPGSGKTTYCDGMQQYLRLLGRGGGDKNNVLVLNFDPANEVPTTTVDENNADGGAEKQQQQQSTTSETTTTSDVDVHTTNKTTTTSNNNNNKLPYDTIYDVCTDAVCLSSVMQQYQLGPNGGLMYCMEYLESNIDRIISEIEKRIQDKPNYYLLFDFPGQVELYTHSTCVHNLLHRLIKKFDLRLAVVQLIDANYCCDATKFLSAALLATTTMLRLELPFVNVLSKVDLLSSQYAGGGEMLPMDFEYYTQCHDLDRLVPFLDTNLSSPAVNNDEFDIDDNNIADDPDYQRARQKRKQSTFYRKYEKLHRSIAEVVEDFGLLSFVPLNISNAESVGRVLARIDQSNGYVFTQQEGSVNENLFQCAIQSDLDNTTNYYESIAEVKEHILSSSSRSIHNNNNNNNKQQSSSSSSSSRGGDGGT